MKRINPILLALTCLLTLSAPTALYAHTDKYPVAEVQKPEEPSPSARERYLRKRLETISKVANLTSEEQKIVSNELIKYDTARFKNWSEMREVYNELSKLKDNVTPEQYIQSFKKIQTLTDERHKAALNFMKALSDRLSPEKAFKTYEAFRTFNANAGKKLRQGKH